MGQTLDREVAGNPFDLSHGDAFVESSAERDRRMGSDHTFAFTSQKREPRLTANQWADSSGSRSLRQSIERRRIWFDQVELGERGRPNSSWSGSISAKVIQDF